MYTCTLLKLGNIADRTIEEADQDRDGAIAFSEFKKASHLILI